MLLLLFAGMGLILTAVIGNVFRLAYNLFIANPFAVGPRNFFSKSLESKGHLKDAFSVFKKGYMNKVKIMFIMELKIILWSFLFIIPGIIKMYEYFMVPYILSDNPDISTEAVFAESKRMMHGEKWNVFVLGLSFIGWNLLSVLIFDLLNIFFVQPYKCYTYAALYHKLSDKDEQFKDKDYSKAFKNNSEEALFTDM